MKPIVYVDVDGTLIRYPATETRDWWLAHPLGIAAPSAGAFLAWAVACCEVRWLTAWCPSGAMDPRYGVPRLANLLSVERSLIEGIVNPLHWVNSKCEAIDWDAHAAGRPWVWIEDETIAREQRELADRRAEGHFIQCDVSLHPLALRSAWRDVGRRFKLSVPDGVVLQTQERGIQLL